VGSVVRRRKTTKPRKWPTAEWDRPTNSGGTSVDDDSGRAADLRGRSEAETFRFEQQIRILSQVSPPSRVTPSQTWPTGHNRSAPLMGFCSLQHMKDRRSTFRGLARPLRSAFRVWLPSWRLTPFGPAPVLFHTGSALGIHPSELSPLERDPGYYTSDGPTAVSPISSPIARSDGPVQ
jgi:hypothetical protein